MVSVFIVLHRLNLHEDIKLLKYRYVDLTSYRSHYMSMWPCVERQGSHRPAQFTVHHKQFSFPPPILLVAHLIAIPCKHTHSGEKLLPKVSSIFTCLILLVTDATSPSLPHVAAASMPPHAATTPSTIKLTFTVTLVNRNDICKSLF